MDKCSLIAAQDQINRRISKSNIVVDSDIFDWMNQDEILVVTQRVLETYLSQSPAEIIEKMLEKKVGALAIKPFARDSVIQSDLIDYANAVHFPIIEIDFELSMMDFNNAITQLLFSRQEVLLQRLQNVHELLTEALLLGGDTKALLKIMGEIVENPVAMIQSRYEGEIHTYGLPEKNLKAFYTDIERIRSMVSHNRVLIKRTMIADRAVEQLMIPIHVNGRLYGRLVCWGANRDLGEFDRAAMEASAATFSLIAMQNVALRNIEIRHQSEFLDDLLWSKDQAPPTGYALDPKRAHLIVLCEIYSDQEMATDMTLRIYDLVDPIRDRLSANSIKGLVTLKRQTLFLLIEEEGPDFDQRLRSTIVSVQRFLDGRMFRKMSGQIRIGVGTPKMRIQDIHHSYIEAVRAIELGRILYKENIIYFSDLGLFQFFTKLDLQPEIHHTVSEIIKPLVNYDEAHETELLRTLEVYFRNNRNIKETAEELFSHYNTVLYRIERAQTILQIDFKNQKERLNFEVALLLSKLYGEGTSSQ